MLTRILKRKIQQMTNQPDEKNTSALRKRVLNSMKTPIQLLTLEPMCLCLCIYSAVLLGILYLFFGAFQILFESVYGFELWQCGLTFLGLLVGMTFSLLSDPYWRSNYNQLEKKYRDIHGEDSGSLPEWRLPPGNTTSSLEWLINDTNCGITSYRRCTTRHSGSVYLCLDLVF